MGFSDLCILIFFENNKKYSGKPNDRLERDFHSTRVRRKTDGNLSGAPTKPHTLERKHPKESMRGSPLNFHPLNTEGPARASCVVLDAAHRGGQAQAWQAL